MIPNQADRTTPADMCRLRNDVGIVDAPNGAYVVALFARELPRDNVEDDAALARISLAIFEEFAG